MTHRQKSANSVVPSRTDATAGTSRDTSRTAEIRSLLSRLAELLTNRDDTPPQDGPEQAGPDMPERVLLTVEEAAKRLGIGRTTAFALVKTGEIVSVQIGRLRRVSVDAVAEKAARL